MFTGIIAEPSSPCRAVHPPVIGEHHAERRRSPGGGSGCTPPVASAAPQARIRGIVQA